MSGSHAAFANLNTGVTGVVRFGDSSVARIKGTGTVLFNYKNGEHRALRNVYFLPHLTANIISIGQLDEGGYQVLVEHGVMRVRDEDRRLLAKIPRSPSWLYTLDVTITRPVCLAHTRTTTPGGGTNVSATSTSPHCARWGARS
jgi:hypothetical protein